MFFDNVHYINLKKNLVHLSDNHACQLKQNNTLTTRAIQVDFSMSYYPAWLYDQVKFGEPY